MLRMKHFGAISIKCTKRTSHNTNNQLSYITRSLSSMSSDSDKNNNDINDKSDESTKLNTRESSNGLFHRNSRPYIYAELSKYRLSALVVVTSGAGFLCAGAPIDLTAMAAVTSGTALCAASAGTFNQVIEKRHDIKMLRTRLRPLPSGRISSAEATAWGVSAGLAGTALLYTATNPVVAGLGAANIFIYAVPYTLSKQHTEWNTWIGSLVGALPPLMGYAAATGGDITGPTPIALASLLFLWQFPHFFALSWLHREDYARGGFQMVAVNDPIGARSAGFIWEYSLYLSALPIITCATGLTSWMFAVEGTIANLYLLSLAHAFKQEQSNAKARAVFLCSLWYLPLLLGGYIFHSKVWNESLHTDDMIKDTLWFIKEKLRTICVHDMISLFNDDNRIETHEEKEISLGEKLCLKLIGDKVIDKSSKIPEDTAALLVNNTKLTDGFVLNDISNMDILENNDRNILNIIDSDMTNDDVIVRSDRNSLNDVNNNDNSPTPSIESEEE